MKSAKDISADEKVKLAAYGTISVVMMGFIFSMSAQAGGESSSLSDAVAWQVIGTLVPGFPGLGDQAQQELFHTLTFVVRKTAHVTEYALLSTFVTAAARQAEAIATGRRKGEKPHASSWLTAVAGTGICIVYAVTDEFHQLFVPGRTGLASDVLVDSVGIVAAALITTAVVRACQRRR